MLSPSPPTVYDGPVAVVPGRAARALLPFVASGLAEATRRGLRVDRVVLDAARTLEQAARADEDRQTARAQAALADAISAASAQTTKMLDGTAEAGGQSPFMTAAGASDLLGVTAHRVRQLRAAGALTGWRGASGQWAFNRTDVEALAASRTRGS